MPQVQVCAVLGVSAHLGTCAWVSADTSKGSARARVTVLGCDEVCACGLAATTSPCFPRKDAIHPHTPTRGDLCGWLRHPGLIIRLVRLCHGKRVQSASAQESCGEVGARLVLRATPVHSPSPQWEAGREGHSPWPQALMPCSCVTSPYHAHRPALTLYQASGTNPCHGRSPVGSQADQGTNPGSVPSMWDTLPLLLSSSEFSHLQNGFNKSHLLGLL